jgi:hypothetical protein
VPIGGVHAFFKRKIEKQENEGDEQGTSHLTPSPPSFLCAPPAFVPYNYTAKTKSADSNLSSFDDRTRQVRSATGAKAIRPTTNTRNPRQTKYR